MRNITIAFLLFLIPVVSFAGNSSSDKPGKKESTTLLSGVKDTAEENKQDASSVDTSKQNTEEINHIISVIKSLDYKTGHISISNNIAGIDVPEGFAFLDSRDAQKVVTDLWNNPRDSDVLGLLMPRYENLFEDSSWAIIYTYEESGHVKDDDAADIKYDELLDQVKKETEEGNSKRITAGFPAIHVVGWAQAPFYDKQSHKLHWAKEIKFGDSKENTLNYNIRMLGRKGVLVMNVVASMNNLKDVQKSLDKIMASTNFTKGNTYADYDKSTDKVAEYGIGGLIAGGVLLKTGLLAKLGLILLKTWKLIAGGIMAAFAFLRKKIFGTKKTDQNSL